MNWTNKTPSIPGWYWRFYNGDIEIVEVEIDSDSEICKVVFWLTGDDYEWYATDDEISNAFWIGPLEIPNVP